MILNISFAPYGCELGKHSKIWMIPNIVVTALYTNSYEIRKTFFEIIY